MVKVLLNLVRTSRILVDVSCRQVHMHQFYRGDGAFPCAGQERERDQSSVAALDLGIHRHIGENTVDMLQGRRFLFPAGCGDTYVLFGDIKII